MSGLCQKCGGVTDPGAKYCESCGVSLSEYPPVESGGRDKDPIGRGLDRRTRSILIAAFVAFDIFVAALLILILSQSS